MEPLVVLYVTGHGYGHATRAAALAQALRPWRVHVRTSAPAWIFLDENPEAECSAAEVDVGMLQPNGVELDLARTLEAHERFLAAWPSLIEREAAFLRSIGAVLVVGDVPPLAFAAAARAGLPSAAVSNFTWDWILEEYVPLDSRWRTVVERYEEAYSACGELFRLPFGGVGRAFRRVTDAPLLARSLRLPRAEARRAAGLEGGPPSVLFSFGGLGSAPLALDGAQDLGGLRFVAFEPPPPGFRGEWTRLSPRDKGLRHVDLLAACDAVISKPGYGIVSECLAHRTPLLYLPRRDFRESAPLEEGARRFGRAAAIPGGDFLAGRWRPHLEALLADRRPWPELDAGGAEFVAARLRSLI